MSAACSLIDEIETSFRSGTSETRAIALRRITELFLSTADELEDDQITLFEDIFTRLTETIERQAVAQMSTQLATAKSAPFGLIRRLSQDDDIEIAGPVLQHSLRLGEGDLVDIARSKSQAHLAAIAGRRHVSEHVSDILIDRGNTHVVATIARNPGAAFSLDGYGKLIGKAADNADIASLLIQRKDLSAEGFRQLVARATDAVQRKLMATAPPAAQERLKGILQDISHDVARSFHPQETTALTAQPVSPDKDELRSQIAAFVRDEKLSDVINTLSGISELPADIIVRLIRNREVEALLIACKASGLPWSTVRGLLGLVLGMSLAEASLLHRYFEQYIKISLQSAQRLVRFLKVRKAASGSQLQTNTDLH